MSFHCCWLWLVSVQLSKEQVPGQSFIFLGILSFSRLFLTDRLLSYGCDYFFILVLFFFFFFLSCKGLSWDNYVTPQALFLLSFCCRLIYFSLMQWRLLSWKNYTPNFSLDILVVFLIKLNQWSIHEQFGLRFVHMVAVRSVLFSFISNFSRIYGGF